MSTDNRVAIFIDAENLTQWIKQGGLDVFLEELTSLGPVVVRKAYARWTNGNVTAHQSTLNRLGFELIHSFHPVSGKNSADIQITVDVMEYAAREELRCIALATGDPSRAHSLFVVSPSCGWSDPCRGQRYQRPRSFSAMVALQLPT